MTVDMLAEYARKSPFESFTIHMTDGSRFKISEPDALVVPLTWKMNAIVLLGGDRFTIIYVKKISHMFRVEESGQKVQNLAPVLIETNFESVLE